MKKPSVQRVEDDLDRLRLAKDWAAVEALLPRHSKASKSKAASAYEQCARAELAEASGDRAKAESLLAAVLKEEEDNADALCALGLLEAQGGDVSRLVKLAAQPNLLPRHARGLEALGRKTKDIAVLNNAATLYGAAWPPGQASCLRCIGDTATDAAEAAHAYLAAIAVEGILADDLQHCHCQLVVRGAAATADKALKEQALKSLDWLSRLGPLPDEVCEPCKLLLGADAALRLCPQLAPQQPAAGDGYRAGLQLAQSSAALVWGPAKEAGLTRAVEMLTQPAVRSWRSLYVAGLCLCHLGRVRAALPLLHRSAAESGLHAAPSTALAWALSRADDAAALRLVERVLARSPAYVPALALRVALRPHDSADCWARYCVAAPAAAWARLATLCTSSEERVACAAKALNADPQDPTSLLCHAVAARSLQAVQALVLRHPSLAAARVELGRMLLASEDASAAAAQVWVAIRLHPRDSAAWTLLGQVTLRQGDAARAAQYLQTAVELEAVEPPLPWPQPVLAE